ncbi:MAG: hypothetical protein D6732_02280 [Methanobacteriota archaeon]|nr:MAG: hypothetical protein D6732_02280 [Euryarchaeota archaeon]
MMRQKSFFLKRIILIILVIGMVQFSPIGETHAANSEPFKVMTYNIEESGKNPDWIQVVKEENPDIAVFIETGAWDDNNNALLNQYCDELNQFFSTEDPYQCVTTQNIEYETSGEAVFSRFPIINVTQIPEVILDDGTVFDVSHDFFDVTVDIGGFYVHVIASHLKCCAGNPENEQKRNKQQEGIINYMDSLGDVPIIYAGDLNSFSPIDVEDPNLAPDSDDLGWGPMTMMVRPDDPTYGSSSSNIHSWIDIFRELNPADPGYTYGHQANNRDGRIDFLIANQYFTLDNFISSTVGDTPTADTGSDHYSVDAVIDITSTSDDTTPPAKVTGLTATTASSSQIDLGWDGNTENDLAYYKIYRDGIFIDTSSTTSYSDIGLDANTTYTYQVSAVDTSGNEGDLSDPVSATTMEETTNSSYIYVQSITWDLDYIRGKNPHYRLDAFILIQDQDGNVVAGATVEILWEFPDGTSKIMTATTDSTGIANFQVDPATEGTHVVSVRDVISSSPYDATKNVETTDSYTI